MKQLFDRFDLTYGGLESVREAAERGDWTAAGERLLAYYLSKRQERCLGFWDQSGPEDYPPMPWGAASTHDQIWKNTPERVVAGYLHASGHVFDFSRDEDIDWASDVRLWADGGKYPYAQARSMLRRMYWLRCLDLYYLRGDAAAQERAARQLVRLIESWWQQWEEDEFVIAAAIRIGEPMAQSGMLKTWFTFLPSPHISAGFKLRLLLHIAEQAEDVLKRAVWNPWIWGLDEAAGLGYAGILLPELKAAPAWRQRCFDYLNEFMLTALRDDGTVKRMHFCPHYVGATATMPLAFLPQIAKLGYTDILTPSARAALERLVDWIANVQKPDNTVPQITASDEQGFGRWISQGAALFNRPDWLYMASAGESGSKPAHTSHILPDAGAFILRDGFTRDAMYAVLHNGDYHNIERTDLALDIYALGRTLVTAPGRYGYYMPEWKPYFATAGYNTLMVDGSPHQEWGTHSLRQRTDLSDTSWYLGESVDWAWGTHPNGFDAAPDVRWQRGLLFVKGRYWLVVDRIEGPGEHEFSLRWLLTPGNAVREQNGMAVHTGNTDANVRLLPSVPTGASVDIWHGSREPLRGWYSPENGVMLPAPQVEYTWRGMAPALVAMLIVPYRSQQLPLFTLEHSEPQPGVHCLAVGRDDGGDRLYLDLRTTGSARLERDDGAGTTTIVQLTGNSQGMNA
jgi:hypothetical protein